MSLGHKWELTQVEYSLTFPITSNPLTLPSSSFTSQWYVSTRSLATGRWPAPAANISGVRPSWGLGGTWSIQDTANNLYKWTECWGGVLLGCMCVCVCTTTDSVMFAVVAVHVCGGGWTQHNFTGCCLHAFMYYCMCMHTHTCECVLLHNHNTTQWMTHMHIRTEIQVTQFTTFSQGTTCGTQWHITLCKSVSCVVGQERSTQRVHQGA